MGIVSRTHEGVPRPFYWKPYQTSCGCALTMGFAVRRHEGVHGTLRTETPHGDLEDHRVQHARLHIKHANLGFVQVETCIC